MSVTETEVSPSKAHATRPWVSWALVVATFGVISAILLIVLRHGQATSIDGVTSETGGRVAVFTLGLVAVVPLFIRRFAVRVPAWVAWLAGLASVAVASTLWLLVRLGMDGTAWAAYGGFQVLRARVSFSDLNWVVQAIHCDFCEAWAEEHGPALIVGKWLTLGQLSPAWVTPLGFLLMIASAVGLVWLIRISPGRGALVLLLAALSPAWLLLLDRANLDAVVFIVLVGGAWLVRRRNTLWAWTVFGVAILLIGGIKYYPFVLGLALLPVLRIRYGWTVIAGFLVAASTYMMIFWSDFTRSANANSESMALLFDFPAYGRLMVLDRMGASSGLPAALASGAMLLMVLLAIGWGARWTRGLSVSSPTFPILAVGGSALFLTSVLIGGFGYMYKGAFLLPMIPLLAMPVVTRSAHARFVLYTSIVSLSCVVLALTVAYSSLLATLAGLLGSSIAMGAALALLWRQHHQHQADALPSAPVRL